MDYFGTTLTFSGKCESALSTTICTLVLTLLLMILMPADLVHAFYYEHEEPEDCVFENEREHVVWDKAERAFVLYDNFNHFSGKNQRGSVVCPYSQYFVPVDQITCNFSIVISVRHPAKVENSLANLLYANLKFKKLVEEYKDVRQKARLLVADLWLPSIDGVIWRPYEQPIETTSIFAKKRELERQHKAIAPHVSSSATSAENERASARMTAESLASLLNKKGISEEMPLEVGRRKSLSAQMPPKPDETEKVRLFYDEKPPLPRIFGAFFNILKYLASHALQTIVCGSILILLVLVLLSVRTR